jgi:hypothetical protein
MQLLDKAVASHKKLLSRYLMENKNIPAILLKAGLE